MIHRIRIQNFKSLRDVTVDLSPVTVLIGKSGTGKSNFVSAIRFLRDCLINPQDVAQQYESCTCATNRSGAMEFTVDFDVPDYPETFCYSLTLGEGPLHPVRSESLEYGQKTLYSQTRQAKGQAWVTEPSLLPPVNPGPIALGRLPGLDESVLAYTVLTSGIGVYAFPFNVLMVKGNSHRNFGLDDQGQNHLEVLRDITSSLQTTSVRKAVAASLRCVNPTVANVTLDSVQNPQNAIVGHHLGDKILQMNLAQESDGFRRFYAYLLALYQTPSKQTLVFEEPENGIYPGALSLLGDEFKAAPNSGRGQILLTTHNPTFLDNFSEDQIRVVELEDLETKIGPLASEQREAVREELLFPGELLTVDAARRQ